MPGNDVCATPYNQLNTNGDVYWHMRCYNDYKLGNIYENDLNDIFYGYSAALFRSEFKNVIMAACTRCCGIMSNDRAEYFCNKIIGYTTGVFDLFHILNLLMNAKYW